MELERPSGTISRTRENSTGKGTKSSQVPGVTQESTDVVTQKPLLSGLVPSRKWIEVSSDSDSSSRKRFASCPDSR